MGRRHSRASLNNQRSRIDRAPVDASRRPWTSLACKRWNARTPFTSGSRLRALSKSEGASAAQSPSLREQRWRRLRRVALGEVEARRRPWRRDGGTETGGEGPQVDREEGGFGCADEHRCGRGQRRRNRGRRVPPPFPARSAAAFRPLRVGRRRIAARRDLAGRRRGSRGALRRSRRVRLGRRRAILAERRRSRWDCARGAAVGGGRRKLGRTGGRRGAGSCGGTGEAGGAAAGSGAIGGGRATTARELAGEGAAMVLGRPGGQRRAGARQDVDRQKQPPPSCVAVALAFAEHHAVTFRLPQMLCVQGLPSPANSNGNARRAADDEPSTARLSQSQKLSSLPARGKSVFARISSLPLLALPPRLPKKKSRNFWVDAISQRTPPHRRRGMAAPAGGRDEMRSGRSIGGR